MAKDLCTYRQLDNGIHELTVLESSRAAVDAIAQHIAEIVCGISLPSPDKPLYLIDQSRVAAVPLVHLRNRLRELDKHRPADLPPGRVAILYDGVMGQVANTMLELAVSNDLHFFKPAERDKALNWLLEAQ